MAAKEVIPDPAGGRWHFDRRVPLALIGMMLVQTATIVWWASRINTRVEHLEEKTRDDAEVVQRVTTVETEVRSMKEYDRRIDSKLDRLFERRRREITIVPTRRALPPALHQHWKGDHHQDSKRCPLFRSDTCH